MKQGLLFFGLGILLLSAIFLEKFYWIEFWGWLLNRSDLNYMSQSAALKDTRTFVELSHWFLLSLLFILDLRRRRYVRTFSFLAGIAFSYVALFGYVFVEPIISDHWYRTSFDSRVWKEGDTTRNDLYPVRLRMVDSLLSRRKLVGMTRTGIDELLGVPPPTTYFDDYNYVYWLGPERGIIRIDSEWLGIKFRDDIVIEATILRD